MRNAADDAKVMEAIREIFVERIPFNRVLGIDVVSLAYDAVEVRFAMRPELIGNFNHARLHGGVISAVHDLTGGMVALVGVQQKLRDKPLAERIARFDRVGTIDLRVDYLRPGKGEWFLCKGVPLRTGNKVAVAHMEIINDAGELISVATGAYTVS